MDIADFGMPRKRQTADEEPKVQCPRYKSEKVERVSLTLGASVGHGWRECKWCGLRFLVDEKGREIKEEGP